jgi:acyl carrier protein
MQETVNIGVDEIVAFLKELSAARGKPVGDIAPAAHFFDLGLLDSLSLLDFITFIEKRYSIEIPGQDIVPENFESLLAVTQYLASRLNGTSKP